MFGSLICFVLDGTLSTLSAFLPENAKSKKILDYIKFPLAFSLLFAISENIADTAMVCSASAATGMLGKVMTHHLFFKSSEENTLSLPYTNRSEELLPLTTCTSSVSDRNSSSSDDSMKSLYFIKQDKFDKIKKELASIIDQLILLNSSYIANNKPLTKAQKKLPKSISNTTINEVNLKIGLITASIEQIKNYTARLEDNHTAACVAFSSSKELVNDIAITKLHALLKDIKRILTELNSSLDRINGVQQLADKIQTLINSIRRYSNSIAFTL